MATDKYTAPFTLIHLPDEPLKYVRPSAYSISNIVIEHIDAPVSPDPASIQSVNAPVSPDSASIKAVIIKRMININEKDITPEDYVLHEVDMPCVNGSLKAHMFVFNLATLQHATLHYKLLTPFEMHRNSLVEFILNGYEQENTAIVIGKAFIYFTRDGTPIAPTFIQVASFLNTVLNERRYINDAEDNEFKGLLHKRPELPNYVPRLYRTIERITEPITMCDITYVNNTVHFKPFEGGKKLQRLEEYIYGFRPLELSVNNFEGQYYTEKDFVNLVMCRYGTYSYYDIIRDEFIVDMGGIFYIYRARCDVYSKLKSAGYTDDEIFINHYAPLGKKLEELHTRMQYYDSDINDIAMGLQVDMTFRRRCLYEHIYQIWLWMVKFEISAAKDTGYTTVYCCDMLKRNFFKPAVLEWLKGETPKRKVRQLHSRSVRRRIEGESSVSSQSSDGSESSYEALYGDDSSNDSCGDSCGCSSDDSDDSDDDDYIDE